ncbi:hypothetical protein GQ54DRAFT_161397 [Martensiomyces pterosporus]|nr:hypothetical protein GQ54DRAFT_161397 [Martensiomyces pterosporus]
MFVKASDKVATQGSTLILPAVSIGNVPQLAVDLLINTLSLPRIGIIDTGSLIPMSGPAGFDHLSEEKAVPLEVYQTEDKKWTIVQQRSPPLAKHHRVFAQEIVEFIKSGGFDRVILLASSDAALRADALISGPQIRTLTVNWSDEDLVSKFRDLSLNDLADTHAGDAADTDRSEALKKSLKQLHSAGITRPLLERCLEEGVPVAACVSLVNEGDNVPDAIMLANAVNAALELLSGVAQWQPPRSWEWLMPSNTPTEMF